MLRKKKKTWKPRNRVKCVHCGEEHEGSDKECVTWLEDHLASEHNTSLAALQSRENGNIDPYRNGKTYRRPIGGPHE